LGRIRHVGFVRSCGCVLRLHYESSRRAPALAREPGEARQLKGNPLLKEKNTQ
jgi:hypothetical protein